jgi:N-acetylmuramoyl-L-alanine amidase
MAAVLLFAALPAAARGKSDAWARQQFSSAERLRQTLNAQVPERRTRSEYQRVVEAYRRVYYGSPTSGKADSSVNSVAELLLEMGRRFDDDKQLHSAISQYEFLRREYPGSRYRFDALMAIGEIYRDDLDDPARARAAFTEFVRKYPHHHLADDANAALNEPVKQANLRSREPLAAPNPAPAGNLSGASRVTSIRHWSTPQYTRIAVDLAQPVQFSSKRIQNPDRIVLDLPGTRLDPKLAARILEIEAGPLRKVRAAQFQSGKTRIVLETRKQTEYKAFLLDDPPRLIVDLNNIDLDGNDAGPGAAPKAAAAASRPAKPQISDASASDDQEEDGPPGSDGSKAAVNQPPHSNVRVIRERSSDKSAAAAKAAKNRKDDLDDAVSREARPTARGDRSLIRALGLKIGKIVIDPGHGGHDTGTIGPEGLEEKELVLEVGRRLGKLLQSRMGADVVYTRKDDTFIPLETRTAIANQALADLFVSIHANSSRDPDARGVETYYLNFTSSSEALEVAARENAASDKSIHELQDLVKKIALKEKIEESREFASDVQRSLHSGLAAKSPGLRDRGVKKAPFVVLIGANMPSILAEISFVSNPGDERHLQTAEYRQRIAESLYKGIAKYVSGLSGVRVASRLDRETNQ